MLPHVAGSGELSFAPMMPSGPFKSHVTVPPCHRPGYVECMVVFQAHVPAAGSFEWFPPPAYQLWLVPLPTLNLPDLADANLVDVNPAWRAIVPNQLWRPPSQPLQVSPVVHAHRTTRADTA